jgi:hypothetical protein
MRFYAFIPKSEQETGLGMQNEGETEAFRILKITVLFEKSALNCPRKF